MGDDEDKKKKIKEDPRCEFFQRYCLKSMFLKFEKWAKMVSVEENKEMMNIWLDNPEQQVFVIMNNPATGLTPMTNFPPLPKGKCCYFIRKNQNPLTIENMREQLMFGDVSSKPIDDLAVIVDEVIFPVLNNPLNQKGWPKVIIKSVNSHIQELRNIVAEVRGNMVNRTLLPLPIAMDNAIKIAGKLDRNPELCDIEMKSSLEGIVIKWCDQIQIVLDEKCTIIFMNNHPTLIDEMDFFNARLTNLENIYDQLCAVRIRTIVMILHKIDSFYFSAFRSIFIKLLTELDEVRDITLYLNPMRKKIEEFEMTDFEESKPQIKPLLHIICLLWANSKYYSTNFHMSNLFKMINNMFINESTKSLDPSSLFQSDVLDSLNKVSTTIDHLQFYRSQYFEFRGRLNEYKKPDKNRIMWSFKYESTFDRFELYLNRLQKINDIFLFAKEFLKLEKVEIGGLRGKIIKRKLMEITEEFNNIFTRWKNIQFDPLDPDPTLHDFDRENDIFLINCDTLERKLAFQFNQAFDECFTVEHTLKLIQLLGSLLSLPRVAEELKSRYMDLVELFSKELDSVKYCFDLGVDNVKRTGNLVDIPIDIGYPAISGSINWIYKLKDCVDKCFKEFIYLEYPIFENDVGNYAIKRSTEMLNILDNYEKEIFSAWAKQLPKEIWLNLNKTLLTRNEKLLSLNFDKILSTALKDVKNMKLMNIQNIPPELVEFFDKEEYYWKIRIKLFRVVEWYNNLHEKTEQCELDLIEKEVEGIDNSLEIVIQNSNWIEIDENYIDDLYNRLKDLHDRVVQTQINKQRILDSIEEWGSVPLFNRKENKGLLNIDERELLIYYRMNECEKTRKLIVEILDENFRLFHRLPVTLKTIGSQVDFNLGLEGERRKSRKQSIITIGSELSMDDFELETNKTYIQTLFYKRYEEHLDKLVGEEILRAVATSIRYLRNELENITETNTPLFEVRCELQEPFIVYFPGLEDGLPDGLIKKFENIIIDIYSMAFVIQRIAQPPEDERTNEDGTVYLDSFLSILENNTTIENMRLDIYAYVKSTLKEALEYLRKFEKFNYLWKVNRTAYLESFLKYGRVLTIHERNDIENNEIQQVREQFPSLDKFQEQIDFYTKLKKSVEQIEKYHDFRVWLRVNFKYFKTSLWKHITKWVDLFMNYLIGRVSDGLQELEEFIIKSNEILSIELDKDNVESLIKIIEILNAIDERKNETDNMFDPLREIVDMLKIYDIEFSEKVLNQFVELPNVWNRLKKLALIVKQSIVPIKQYQIDLNTKRINLFNARMKYYRERFKLLPFFFAPCLISYEILDKVHDELVNLEIQYDKLSEIAVLFVLDPPNRNPLTKCQEEVNLLKILWDKVYVIESTIENWKLTTWKKINVDIMDSDCKNFTKELRVLDKAMRSWEPYLYAESSLKNLMTSLRAVVELQNPAIRDRHWEELMAATHVKFNMDDSTTLKDLLDLELHRYEDDVKNTVDKSVKEMAMEKAIKEMRVTWSTMVFEYDEHDRTKLKILRASEELIEILEENQVQLQNMLGSKYIAYFFDIVSEWQTKLATADQVINVWFEVQRKWIYLESIFIGSEDIRNQLPEHSARFVIVDKQFKKLLGIVFEDPIVIKATNKPIILESLENMLVDLILCEKALNEYLDTKRIAYPRFYFVSSADLLDILSNGTNPPAVGKHLTKLYDSLAQLVYEGAGSKNAYEMVSKENDEHVKLIKSCDCSGKVEIWLNRVTDSMRDTLHSLFGKANAAYEDHPRDVLILEYPAQTALCTTQIWWTVEVNAAFAKLEDGYENALKDYNKKQVLQLNTLINLLLGDLSVGDRQKIMTVCTIDVHSRDVVAKMILQMVETSSAFQWQSQLRHRWDSKLNNCFANICDAQFKYDYEYLGNTPRLVITPLTDRCYITLTQSLHLIMGGAPAGPAGTGKTETTKDLGRALGIMVYVFNCSEQMDYKSCGEIYKGLAQTGAWGCFDEFNRIAVEVLSVVAVQVKSIQDAIKVQKSRFIFMGEDIKLISTVGLFITMNPGYAGRTELPENLKALFRPCAMVVPDFALICEIMLVAEGFQEARLLARKFITLYTLCRELLSKQDHYDWGLRAIKSVLVVAGALKRGDRTRPEDQVLMRALRDFNIPKIVTDDVPIFMGLIGDLFPALDVPRKRDEAFEALVKKSAIDLNLQPEDGFILKIVQLEELFAVRHSVFINGFAGTGKSQVWKTLFRTYQNQNRKPFYNDLNPKAVTNNELFGVINPATREWKDGLFSVIMRDQANMGGTGPKWIVLDGDIDPMWIESLNTLMDDNKVLTLASNERIALTKEMRLLFEIASLRTATPATVSRAGILYINPQDLGWNPFVLSWLDSRKSATERSILNVLFEKYIPQLLGASNLKFKKITPISEIAQIQMVCHLLDCLLTPANVPYGCPKEWYELYFVFATIWGFGSTLFQDQIIDWRSEFNKWWINEFKSVKFPASGGTIFNFFIDPITKKLLPWSDLVQPFELDPDIPLQATLVNTAETTRLRYFMDILIEKSHPVMLIGGAGSGKSVIVADKLHNLSDKYMVTNVPFNYYTTSQMLQQVLEKPLEKKAGRNYGPPGAKTMIYFIDDMNMPEVDKYGTVQPHTIINQFMDYKHWYDREKLSLKDILHCQFISCMNPTAGSFTISPRLQRHFCSFAVSFPGPEALFHIYQSILSQHIAAPANKFNKIILNIVDDIINVSINLHQKMEQNFLPTAVKFHYIFNMRDMANIFGGIMFGNGETCPNEQMLMRLYIHEAIRVYGDKLVDNADIQLFNKLVIEVTKKGLETMNVEKVFAQPIMFCHFAEGLAEPKYKNVESWPSLLKLLEECQSSYNEMIGAMNLVLFEDAMSHICRINRILEAPRGYALLIGVGGSGKQSLTRLAAFISALEVFQVQLRKGYGLVELRNDLGLLYIKSAIKNQPTAFLMTDSQVAEEIFLVLINDLLASGEIPDLFPEEDMENIINALRNEVKALGIFDTKENCYKYFIEKVRRTLKIVLCFSPVSATLRVRSRKFPAIVNCTSIDWFHEWPKTALESVSRRFLAELEEIPSNLTESVAVFMAYVHGTVNDMSKVYLVNEKRYNYTTPKSFLELISLYSKLLSENVFATNDRILKLENGLLKLEACAAQVDSLKDILKDQEVILKEKNDAADKFLVVVSAENEKVQKEKNFANEEEKKVRIIEEDVSVKQRVCTEDLKLSAPTILAAEEALKTLNKNNLTELKSFGSPPEIVITITACVLILFSKGKIPQDRSWKACKLMMNKVDKFLYDLINFDKKHISSETIKAIFPYINDSEFDPEKVRSKSLAGAGLCSWVINIHKFYEIYLIVGPKERALDQANFQLQQAQDKLLVLKDQIGLLEDKLSVIQKEFDIAMSAKQKCQAEADKTAFTIDLAHRLVNGLASENIRWRQSVKDLKNNIKLLTGDILLISCFISYVGCFTRGYRLELLNKFWFPTFKTIEPQIPVGENSDPLQMICDDAQIAIWNNEGLPSDRMSSENATILTNSARWPLMIDPQLQGIKWIKQKFGNKLRVIRLNQRNYLDRIEKAVNRGDTLLIENIGETVDAVLEPLLGRVLIKKGKVMKIGDTEIDYNTNFKLILQTKLANPHYKPEMQAQTTLINFTVTRDGLEEQLLGEVVKAERPDLEKLKTDLTMQQNSFKITLKVLEDDLLQRLSSAGENVLEDSTLVLNLEKTKKTAAEIEVKVKEAKIATVQIDEAREHYRIAAERASLLYFILNDLFKINPIYQFSLKAFTVVFKNAIKNSPAAENVKTRVLNLIDSITFFVCQYTTRGLFEQDKIIFLAQLVIQIFVQEKDVRKIDLDFLLKFPYTPNVLSPLDFMTNIGWGGIKTLSGIEEFRNLDRDMEALSKRWKSFVDSETPEKEKYPGEWKNKKPIQKLCIMRCLRPDRMSYAILECIELKLGSKYVEGRALDLSKSFEEMSNSTPIFFILSPGVDPLKDVEKLGKRLKYSTEHQNFYNVSLGQGQEVVAELAMDKASKEGHWVILQNIHLVARWLSTLEKKMEATGDNSHDTYRLFISAEPAPDPSFHIIPQGILESAIKITNEPPTGMMANLHKALDNFTQETLEMCSKEPEFKAILFSLCYFHAVVAERRKFGPQGWNRVYPFNIGDLTICVYVLHNYLEANMRVPWEDLRYLFGEIMYGGHITDDWDRRLCRTYLEEYMQPELIDGDLYFCNGFLAPPNTDYQGYHDYIDSELPSESPYLYGLHPNAEIGFLTTLSDRVFKILFELQPRDSGASSDATVSREDTVKAIIEDITDKLPEEYNMTEIMARVEDRTPFIIVAFQECERMNNLVREIRRSLKELLLGLKGELTITPIMEELDECLYIDMVPESWTKLAYPSLLGLQTWFADLTVRIRELEKWSAEFQLPPSVWLAGFFNPQSFLTAIMQQTARKNEWPLDKMCLNCDVTKRQKEDFTMPPREGAYVNGLFMEGARWDTKNGTIGESMLKELFPPMPVIFIKAVTQDKQDVKNVYECPVYKIRMRGPTFVWTFNLKTKEKAAKWTLAGVCLLLQT